MGEENVKRLFETVARIIENKEKVKVSVAVKKREADAA